MEALTRSTLRRLKGIGGLWIYLAVSAIAAGLLSLVFVTKGKAFAFYDIGSDTLVSFYPLQIAVARQLKALHDVTWSFELGLGGYLGTLFDPFWLITGWLPESWQLPLRLPMFLSRLVLGGAFLYGYLRRLGWLEPVAVIGGLGYAFSSYALIGTQWEVAHGTEFVQLAAVLFLFERQLRHSAPWTGICAGVAAGLGYPIAIYMLALFALLYAIVRLAAAPPLERQDILRATASFVLWSIVGLALTAPFSLPALHYFFENPRVSGEHSVLRNLLAGLFSINDSATIGSELAGLLGKDLLGTGNQYAGVGNYFEGPGFFVGLLPLLCMTQLIAPGAMRRERMLFAVGIGGCVLYFLFPALRYAVYGFGHAAFRFSTLWVSTLLLVLGLAGLQRALASGWWRPGVLAGAAAVFAIVAGAIVLMPGKVNVEHAIHVVAFTALYVAVVFASGSAADPHRLAFLLLAICACELVTFAIPPVARRDAVNSDGSSQVGRYDDDTLQALDLVRRSDDSGTFYRIEKTYHSLFLADALVQDYAGTASYYFHAASLTRFVDRMQLPRVNASPNYIDSMASRPAVLDLLGVRYVLSRQRNLDEVPGMTYLARAGSIVVYRNDAAHGFATLLGAVGSEAQADALAPPQRDALLLTTAIVDDAERVKAALAQLHGAGTAPALQARAHIALLRDDELQGTVDTPSAALLLLAMPFDSGWNAWLDGKRLDLFCADYGLTAALLPAGGHALALRYLPPGRAPGFAAMAGALAFIAVFAMWRRPRPSESRA